MGRLTTKASGNIASFISPTVTPIESARVYFSPTQLGEGTPSPENVREIVGRTSVELKQCGKNLLDPNIFTNIGYISSDGAIVNNSDFKYCDSFILKKGNYIFTGINGNSGAPNVRIHLYDKNDVWLKQITSQSKTYNSSYSIPFEITDNVSYIRLSVPKNLINGQLELGSTATPYEPYQGTTYSIDWTDDVGNIYGGYVDLVKGEIVEEYRYLRLDANTPCSELRIQSSELYTIWYYIDDMASGSISEFYNNPNIMCSNIKKVSSRGSIPNTQLGILFGSNSITNSVYLYNMNTTYGYTTKEQISTWLDENPIYVTVPLATPITHQLTPTQLKSFVGQNNFWSNADYVEVEYDLIETFDIQKAKRKIIMNQPHVESASNSPSSPQVIKFKTDMKAPLKQCVVNFAPIQEGSGDPSPDNIRPIKGWNGITLKHTGINMLQCSSPSYYIDVTNNGITSQSSKNADNEIIGIDFNGTTTSTNIFRNLNYNPSDSGAVTMPRGLMGLTGYSDQVYVVPKGNGNAPRMTDGRYWTGANTNSENGWNVWSVDSSETYNGLWVRTQVFPRKTNVNVDTTVYPMMCLAEDVGCEFEPYKGETFDVDWTDEIGTVYGGYIDLVSGQLVAEWIERMINSFDWSYNSSGECFRASANIKRKSVNAISPIRSKIYKTTNVYNSISYWLNVDDFSISEHIETSSQGELINSIHIKDSRYTTVSDFLNGVGNESIIYELAEPIHYSLTPQQIITFKGQNNIWANTNKLTEIKYWNHKKSYSTGVIYEAENLTFDGTNYIDTGVYLFSEENINRDFEVVIEDLYGDYETGSVTIVCAKYDSKAIGFLIRLNDSTSITYNGTISMKASYNNNITIRRINGVITCEGSIITNPTVKFTNTVHNHPLVLGCALQDDGTPFRYATGTIGHITVKWL